MSRSEVIGRYEADGCAQKLRYVLRDICGNVFKVILEGEPFRAVPHGVLWNPRRIPNKFGTGFILVCETEDSSMRAFALPNWKHGYWADNCSSERKGVYIPYVKELTVDEVLIQHGFNPNQCLITFHDVFDTIVVNYWKSGEPEPFILTDGIVSEGIDLSDYYSPGGNLHRREYSVRGANFLIKGDPGYHTIMVLRNKNRFDEKITRVIRDRFRKLIER